MHLQEKRRTDSEEWLVTRRSCNCTTVGNRSGCPREVDIASMPWPQVPESHSLFEAMFIPCQRGHRLDEVSKDETPLLEESPTLLWCNPNAAYYEAMVYQAPILKFWLNRGAECMA